MKAGIIFVLLTGILLTSCQQPQVIDAELSYQVAERPDVYYDEQDLHDIDNFGEIDIVWYHGNVQYGSRIEGNNRVLYAVESNGTGITQLAVFPTLNVEWGQVETEWCRPPEIIYLDVVDDWIIISVGEFQGSGGFFFGGIFRVGRDGNGREQFQFGWDNPGFIIINDWIYHNDMDIQGMGDGWIRIRPDGTDKEYLDEAIHSIYLFAEDGYIYGAHATSETVNGWNPVTNLVRWQPDSDESTVLFFGENLPICEYSNHIGFQDIRVFDDYVLFTAFVWGYRDGDSWRGSLLYKAAYKVDKDGSNLILLREESF